MKPRPSRLGIGILLVIASIVALRNVLLNDGPMKYSNADEATGGQLASAFLFLAGSLLIYKSLERTSVETDKTDDTKNA